MLEINSSLTMTSLKRKHILVNAHAIHVRKNTEKEAQ